MFPDRGVIVLKEKFMRLPLKMEAPEVVLAQAYGQARPITDFLHENGKIYVFEYLGLLCYYCMK